MTDINDLVSALSCKATNAKAILEVVIDSLSASPNRGEETRRAVAALYGLLELMTAIEEQAETAEMASRELPA